MILLDEFLSASLLYSALNSALPVRTADLLKIIQLGITFADENGELAADCPTWQFNFRFNLLEDMYAQVCVWFVSH